MKSPILAVALALVLASCGPFLIDNPFSTGKETTPRPPNSDMASLLREMASYPPGGIRLAPTIDPLSYLVFPSEGCPASFGGFYKKPLRQQVLQIKDAMNRRFAVAAQSADPVVKHLLKRGTEARDELLRMEDTLGIPVYMDVYPSCTPENGMIRVRMSTDLSIVSPLGIFLVGFTWKDLGHSSALPSWGSYTADLQVEED